jgi:3-hydroxybutyryl-CoA dehydrogenase
MVKQPQRIAIIGAGTMGHGIAQVAALSGYQVGLFDLTENALQHALSRVKHNLEGAVSRNKITQAEAEEAITHIYCDTALNKVLNEKEFIIEAVPENMSLKKQILSEIDANSSKDAIIASNTSSLSLTELQSATQTPHRVIGLHFFNPVHIMKLVEIVVGAHTAPDVITASQRFVESLKKQSIVVKDSPGFATSRLGITLGNEAMRMLEEGVATAEDIDLAMELGYRHPIGPLKLSDLVGLDVRLAITEHLYNELGTDTFKAPDILKKLVGNGCLGRKSGQGFYSYDESSD